MKKFYYDTLLDRENICNLSKEREGIEKAIEKRSKLVVYGSRNFGKTSLLRSIILPDFVSNHKTGFVFFADLMEVKSLDSIDIRISKAFEHSFAQSFPAKNFMDGVRRFLGNLSPQVSIDPVSGTPSLSITKTSHDKTRSCEEIFKAIIDISKERETIIVLDEFQDIAFVDEAQGLFRRLFQEIKEIPIIVMGSKRHILGDILAKPSAPLSMFGEDIEFMPIPYKEYHDYIMERFETKGLNIGEEDSAFLQDAVLRVPEAVNIVCAEILEENTDKKIERIDIENAIRGAVEKRHSRYEEYISHFSENEESIAVAIAKKIKVKQPNGKEFLKLVKPTSRMVGIIFGQLYNKSIIEKGEDGYYVSDPLFAYYLRNYR